jgi:hypothetical protein
MVFMRDRRPEQGHDAVARVLIDRTLEAVHPFGEDCEEAIHDLMPLFGIHLLGKVHRALRVGEEKRHLFALPFEGAARCQDLLGKVLRGVRARIGGWTGRTRADGLSALQAELGSSRQLGAAGGAAMSELRAALEAEPGVLRILGRAAPTPHLEPRYESSSRSAFASFRSAVSKPSVNQA